MGTDQKLFDITKDSKIYLYACNAICLNAAKKMKMQGFSKVSIIDREQKDVQDIKCYSFSNYLETVCEADDVVIICLTDGEKHYDVAKTLYDYGIENILYIPIVSAIDMWNTNILRDKYNNFFFGYYDVLNNIPRFDPMISKYKIIKKYPEGIVFWCPCDILFTMTEEQLNQNVAPSVREHFDIVLKYANLPIRNYQPYVELFNYLVDGKGNLDEYLTLFAGGKPETHLANRIALYNNYEYATKYDPLFFVLSPLRGKLAEDGKIHVVDGLHRAHYLMRKGYEALPIYLEQEEYDCFTQNIGG